ncbi:MAG: DUF1684 domain-containing protein [Sphingobacteriales bacterium]|nr:MAG: DUF1684 domain-containing protein [Sphingobacteriales bacterium]
MKFIPVLLLLLLSVELFAQKDSAKTIVQENVKYREELDAEYKDPKTSPLNETDIKTFTKHDFYPVDLKYRVVAKLIKADDEAFFGMKTTSEKIKSYRKYGELHFVLLGKTYKLNVYQSEDLMKKDAYKDYLFLPFTDLTTGETTYGGGRYIDIRTPVSGDEIIVDFNKAYNPYCAYSTKYSCPIVPQENFLNTKIKAGIKLKHKM